MPVNALRQQLAEELRQILPMARLEDIVLPDCKGLVLCLMGKDYPVESLSADEARKVMDNPLYWMFCWASGRVMARNILAAPELVRDKTVLDVGSGSGVVAIAAAMAGAARVIAADIDPVSQVAMALNARLNDVELQIIGDVRSCQDPVDVITIADVLYDKANMPLLDYLLDRAPQVWLADSRVRDFTHPRFAHLGKAKGETFPSLGGFDEFFEVNLYQAG